MTDAPALAAAHDAALRNTSFTIHRNLTLRYPNGTVAYQQLSTTRIDEHHERLFVDASYSLADGLDSVGPRHGEPTTGMEVWLANRTYLAKATFAPDNITYRGTAFNESTSDTYEIFWASESRTDQLQFAHALSGAIVGEPFARNGTTLYRVTATDPSRSPSMRFFPDAPRGAFEQPRNASTSALVSEQGIVHQSTTTFFTTVEKDDVPVRVEYTVRFTDVGSTIVERPPWYETARNRTDLSEFGG